MTEENLLCSECKRVLVLKLIELKDLIFCSNKCFEKYVNKMGQKNFQRKYGSVFLLDGVKKQ